MKNKRRNIEGISLLEILVVIAIFTVLAVITTRAVLLTLRGSRKSESMAKVREDLDYSLSVIDRNLRNAEEIDVASCTGNRVDYVDELGNSSYFACLETSGVGYVASGSARLTSNKVDVISCNFSCDDTISPPSVTISLEAQSTEGSGIEGSVVTVSTKIYLRNY
jgi:hypothetical protein